jgi:hypothetical protein
LTDVSRPGPRERPKWRPSLGLVVFVVLATVLALPLFSLYFLRIYENQLIRQTEGELIAQSAALAATLHREIETSVPANVPLGAKVQPRADASASQAVINDEPYRPIWPELDLSNGNILPPRPAGLPPASPPDPAFVALGVRMMPDLVLTQNLTLAGFRLLILKKLPTRCRGVSAASCAPASPGTSRRRSNRSAAAPVCACSPPFR